MPHCSPHELAQLGRPQYAVPLKLAAVVPKSTGTDPNAPAGAVNPKLTPMQTFAIECYIGAAVEGGYAKNLYEGVEKLERTRTEYDRIAAMRTPNGNIVAPRYWVIKEVLGPELEQTRGAGEAGFAATFERALADLAREGPRADIPRWSRLLATRLSEPTRQTLARNQVDPPSAVGNFLAIRSAMLPVEGALVRGVTGGELKVEPGTMPPIGEPIPFSSSRGTAISTNPVEYLNDTVDYVLGKVNGTHPQHAGKDAFVLVYPPETVEGVSILSMGGPAVDAVENHLSVNLGTDGKEYRDPAIIVSKREVIASPREDLVVSGIYHVRQRPGLVYLVLGKKGAVPLGEHWED